MVTTCPMVSVGVPVRNGAKFLDGALRSLLDQTYTNIEVIISDNRSSDGSGEIAERYAQSDKRIKLFKQPSDLRAIDNFRFVFEQSRGEFFMWAACDDRRNPTYIERLVETMSGNPSASVAFGDLMEFSDFSQWQDGTIVPHSFATSPDEIWTKRLRRITRSMGHHVYGLIRSSSLRPYQWKAIVDRDDDVPLNVHLILIGDLVYAPGAQFFYYRPQVAKTLEQFTNENNLSLPKKFPELRMAWACADSARTALKTSGRNVPIIFLFGIVWFNRQWGKIKPRLFDLAPGWIVNVYRGVFKRESQR